MNVTLCFLAAKSAHHLVRGLGWRHTIGIADNDPATKPRSQGGVTIMAYKTILVSLNEIARLDSLNHAARRLGAAFEAHVAGVYVIPSVQFYPSVGLEAVPQVFEGHRTYFKDHSEEVRASFSAAMSKEGISFDAAVVEAQSPLIADELVARGRSADLIIISATNPDQATGVELDCVERVVMSAGRPVLVLPYKGKDTLDLGEVVVGWNGHREAARAAFDALPLLKLAGKVSIIHVDPQKDPEQRAGLPGADLAEALARHGVKAMAEGLKTEGVEAGQALLRKANETGAGILVMGAYGHSRLREFVFGGATSHVLGHLDRPVLMSH
jgi:nucleotide-binding universal stress UspA family protein